MLKKIYIIFKYLKWLNNLLATYPPVNYRCVKVWMALKWLWAHWNAY